MDNKLTDQKYLLSVTLVKQLISLTSLEKPSVTIINHPGKLPQLSSMICYCLYILHHFILQNAQFYLAVDSFSCLQLDKIQCTLTRFIRKWLHLPSYLSKALLFHKDGLVLKSLPSFEEEVKVGFFTRVVSSADPSVSECAQGLDQDTFENLYHMSVQDIDIITSTSTLIKNSRQHSSRVSESYIIRRSKAYNCTTAMC